MQAGELFARSIEKKAAPLLFEVAPIKETTAFNNWKTTEQKAETDTLQPQTLKTMVREEGAKFQFNQKGNRRIKMIHGFISLRDQTVSLTLDYHVVYKNDKFRLRNILYYPPENPQVMTFKAIYDN